MDRSIFADCNSVLETLGILAGAASVCWDGTGEEIIFDSEKANAIVQQAHERIKEIIATDRASEFSGNPTPVGDYYDEDTLTKFLNSLLEAGMDADRGKHVIDIILNNGLLIRERQ